MLGIDIDNALVMSSRRLLKKELETEPGAQKWSDEANFEAQRSQCRGLCVTTLLCAAGRSLHSHRGEPTDFDAP
jgi:hypothetical protein